MANSQSSPSTGTRAVLVTGATGGIGRALVERLAVEGYLVYAAARSPEKLQFRNRQVVPVALDLTDEASINRASAEVSEHLGNGRFEGLVNMAGIIVEGPLELVEVDLMALQFAVNVLGPFALTRAFLPLLRRSRGRVINIGAVTAHTAMPFNGPISASKAALASLNDAMRMEFAPFGIKVVLVEPGGIETGIFATAANLKEESLKRQAKDTVAFYRPLMAAMQETLAKSPVDKPKVIVDAVHAALTKANPAPRSVVGRGAGLLAGLSKLPTGLRDRVLMSATGIGKPFRQAVSTNPLK